MPVKRFAPQGQLALNQTSLLLALLYVQSVMIMKALGVSQFALNRVQSSAINKIYLIKYWRIKL